MLGFSTCLGGLKTIFESKHDLSGIFFSENDYDSIIAVKIMYQFNRVLSKMLHDPFLKYYIEKLLSFLICGIFYCRGGARF